MTKKGLPRYVYEDRGYYRFIRRAREGASGVFERSAQPFAYLWMARAGSWTTSLLNGCGGA